MADAHVQERILELRQVPALRSVPPRILAELASSVELETHPPGAALMREGEPVGSAAWIVDGRAVWTRDGRRLGVAELGASIGLLEVTASQLATAGVRAETDVALARIGAERWIELLEDSFDIAHAVLSAITGELAVLGRRRFGEPPSSRWVAEPPSRELDFAERIVLFRKSLPFCRAPIRTLAVLAQRAAIRSLPRGGVLWERGQEAREVMVLLEGAVNEARARFGEGDTVGLVEALAGRRREAQALAHAPVRAIAFDVEALMDVLEDDEELAIELLRVCASELLSAGIDRGLPPDVLGGAPDRSLPRARRSPFDTVS